jgi:hypothetical protein
MSEFTRINREGPFKQVHKNYREWRRFFSRAAAMTAQSKNSFTAQDAEES